jgi:hypothetical protein
MVHDIAAAIAAHENTRNMFETDMVAIPHFMKWRNLRSAVIAFIKSECPWVTITGKMRAKAFREIWWSTIVPSLPWS